LQDQDDQKKRRKHFGLLEGPLQSGVQTKEGGGIQKAKAVTVCGKAQQPLRKKKTRALGWK